MVYEHEGKKKIKLIDWGFSLIGRGHYVQRGSEHYTSPEMIENKTYMRPCNDVWSAGVVLYALLAYELPFRDVNMADTFEKIKKVDVSYEHIDSEDVSFVKRFFAPFEHREMCVELLQDSWFDDL